MYKAIDLFSGAGGFTCGFRQSGFNVVKALEINSQIAETYKKNNPNTNMIVDDIVNADKNNYFKKGDADVIIGGPPCQGFSMAGARNRNGFMGDPRNFLFKHYFNIVKTVRPKCFVFENVKGLVSMEHGEIFNEIKKIFSDKNLLDGDYYELKWQIVNSFDFGVPQKRERFILIGILNGKNTDFDSIFEKTRNQIKNEIPHFFDKVTVKDAISNLQETTTSGEVKNTRPENKYQEFLYSNKDSKIYNQSSRNHSEKALTRIKEVKPGENFKSLHDKIKSIHSGSYGRMVWNEPAVTITTRYDTPSGGRYIHPSENRTITDREAARIQSFPDNYVFVGNKTSISTQIGNAVPPKMAMFLAKMVENILN